MDKSKWPFGHLSLTTKHQNIFVAIVTRRFPKESKVSELKNKISQYIFTIYDKHKLLLMNYRNGTKFNIYIGKIN